MMKIVGYVFIGTLVGLCAGAAGIYLAGLLLEALGIALYHSEADQQRNFNAALIGVVVITGLGGFLGYRRAKQPSQNARRRIDR
jgi:hypothetical protein